MKAKNIQFGTPEPSKSGKTKVWQVMAITDPWYLVDDCSIGEIKYRATWRRYAFFPKPDTLYEQDCLRLIADFCEDKTKKLRKTWAKRKKESTA